MIFSHVIMRFFAASAALMACACGQILPNNAATDLAPVGVWSLPIEQTPGRARAKARLELGQAYFEQGQASIAMQEIALAQAADPQWIAVHNLKALVLESLGHSELARNSFEEALRWAQRNQSLGSEVADLQHNWGLWLCAHGFSEQAVLQFNRAMLQPGYALRDKTQLALARCPSMAKG